MKIIDKYLWQEVTTNILFILLGLIAMFSFVDFIQELDSVGQGNYGVSRMIIFVLLSAPGHIYDVAPVAVLVGAMYSLGQLSRNSELVILRVSGVSLFDIAMNLLRVALVFALVTFLVGEFITPFSEKLAQRLRMQAKESVVAQDFRSGLWVKDGKSFVNVETVLPDATLLNLHIYEFDENFHLKTIRNAKEAKFEDNRWNLTDMTQIEFGKTHYSTHVTSHFYPTANWQSLIRPELLNVLLVVPSKMSAWNLYSFIAHLQLNNQKTTRYDVALWAKLVYPLACLVMMILALPFGFLQQRSSTTTTKIFVGMFLGVMYQILNRIFAHLGTLNDWTPFFSAVAPTVLFLIAGLTMLAIVERR